MVTRSKAVATSLLLAAAALVVSATGCTGPGSTRTTVAASVTTGGPTASYRVLPAGARAVKVNGRWYRLYRGSYYRWHSAGRVWIVARP